MRMWKKRLIALPLLGGVVMFAYRAFHAGRYVRKPIVNYFRWLVTSREADNYSVEITQRCKKQLGSLIAHILDIDPTLVEGWIREIDSDAVLRAHVRSATQAYRKSHARGDVTWYADEEARFGKRVGWYAMVRGLKPKVVMETGVEKGLGSVVIAAALMRNDKEGYPGRHYGTDINESAGYLLSGEYSRYGTVLYGDSLDTLRGFSNPIDLFINDSDHSSEYEALEYSVITEKLSPNAIVLGDNAHCNDVLVEWAHKTGRDFIYFRDESLNHWYPGAGIGFAFRKRRGDSVHS